VAFQAADYAGWNLWASINRRPLLPFKYQHLGDMMALGTMDAAVAFPLDLTVDGSHPIPRRRRPPPHAIPVVSRQTSFPLYRHLWSVGNMSVGSKERAHDRQADIGKALRMDGRDGGQCVAQSGICVPAANAGAGSKGWLGHGVAPAGGSVGHQRCQAAGQVGGLGLRAAGGAKRVARSRPCTS
jgi:hypothetical protein